MTYQERKELALSYLNNSDKLNDYRPLFNRIYPFSTENLTGFFNDNLVKDKKILVTGSSCDQVLSAQLFDAKEITHFDINPFVEFMYNLKISAVKELEAYEFLDYFYYNFENTDSFRYKTYEKIRKSLSGNSLDFWDTLYSNSSPLKIRRRLFILNNEEELNKYKYILPYMFPDNYRKLKEKELIPVEFINSDILRLPQNLKNKYDMIYFSNILGREEMIDFYDNDYFENVYKFINGILEHTEEEGKILLNYFYDLVQNDFNNKNNKMLYLYVTSTIEMFNCRNNIDFHEISSIDEGMKDTILIYTKKNTKK